MEIKSVQVDPKRVKAGPDDGLKEGEFLVYPSTFTREPDAYGDVVAKGAFERTIKEWADSGNVLPGLFGHRMDDPDFFVAGAIEMGEDDHGWWVKGEFDMDSPKGAHVYRLVKGRRLSQLSFAYDVREDGVVEVAEGQKANELRDLKVYEFSFVPVGANQDTSVVAVKGIIDGLKAGRTISSKNEKSLREARDSIDSVLSSLGEEGDGKSAPADTTDQGEKASESPASQSDDGADESAPESDPESKTGPSARDLAASKFNIYAAAYVAGKES